MQVVHGRFCINLIGWHRDDAQPCCFTL
jgi:hypothetical protein